MSGEASTIKILIATDNHLGYMEKDALRGRDSLTTFEEILKIAKTNQVDFILLGGDLFHDNKPSRACLYSTMALFREYCWGDRACPLEMLSDPSAMLAGQRISTVNYLDPNINVSLFHNLQVSTPVFTIHGNHDDPTGDGRYSAVDLLAVAGFVNYYGKVGNVDDITLSPILLKKGDTKLALYGLGNVRDERLNRTFRRRNVKIMRPEEEEDGGDPWFNLMVLHQNRAAHGRRNYIPENFLDNFLNFVVWGHEHECIIDPVLNPVQGFHISQPGSSVATSLSEGEQKAKHVGILRILEKVRLKSVRPFKMAETILSRDLKDNKNKDKAVGAHLRDMVKNMIRIAREEYTELNPEVEEGMIPRPLIRVKVEYSGGFTTYNPQQFGREFVGQVANPKDILLFYRKRVFSKEGNEMKADTKAQPTVPISIPTHLEEGAKMEDLVQEYLDAQELKILPENQLMEAVGIFVDKDDKEAIKEFVSMSLERSRAMLSNLDIDGDDVDMAEEAESVKKKLAKDFMETGVPLVVNTKKSAAAGTGKSTGGRKKKDSDSESEEEVVVKKKKAPAKPAAKPRATKAKPKKKVVSEDEEIDESEEEVKPKKSSAKGKQRAESVEEDMFEDEEDDVIPASRPVRSGVSVKAGGSRKLPFGGGLKRKVESGGEGAAKKKGRQSSIVGFVKREDDDDE